jgi:hypothetical protein
MKKVAILLLLIATISAEQLKVPSAYSTIQAGLNAASSGDTVLVAAGTYAENIIWPDVNGIKLISAGDSSNAIIDGGGTSSVIYMNPSSATIDTTTLIQGFTIMNGGSVYYGGGFYINNASPKIMDLTVSYNVTNNGGGGGIYISNSNLVLKNVIISNNIADGGTSHDNSYGRGGGILIEVGSIPSLNNVTISGNTANFGGGIYQVDDSPFANLKNVMIKNNVVSTSYCFGKGGGIYMSSKIYMENVSVINNSACGEGGGIQWWPSGADTLSNVIISGNSTTGDGGGIRTYGTSNSTITNVQLINNTSSSAGGGMKLQGIYKISNTLIYNNKLTSPNSCNGCEGGGAEIYGGDVIIDSTIIVNNSSNNNAGGLIKWGGGSITYNFVTIVGNTGVDGGGIYNNSSTANFNNVTIVNNQGTGTGDGITSSGGVLTVSESNIAHNGQSLINEDNSNFAVAANNYWGHSSGPYHPTQNPTGQGDSTNAFVNVTPWLTAPNTDAPPIPAQNLKLTASTATSASFSWDASKIGDLAGYKFYYDTDSSGYPYANSVDLGNVVTKSLTVLTAGTKYYIAVSTYDTDGNESWYSKEVSVTMNNTPVIAEVSDVTINEDESSTVTLSATDVESDAITYSAVSDTNAVTVSVSSATLTLTPNANWHGVAKIKAYASDGSSKDSTSFILTVTPVNDAPTAFDWVSIALDTVNISQSNLADTYSLQWDASTDVDGDSITYLLYGGTGASPKEEVYKTTSTLLPIPYQEFLQKTFEQIPMLSRATAKFSVSATDGIDTVKVTGDDRFLFVNRYEYLSTESEGIPIEFALHENYPNPFNPTTTLRFDLPEVSSITLTIYNMLGQKVRTFNYQNTSAGYHSVKWNANNDFGDPVGAGIYLYQLQTKDFVKTRKMVLLK